MIRLQTWAGRWSVRVLASLMALVLVACGGGATQVVAVGGRSAQQGAGSADGAALNAAELASAEAASQAADAAVVSAPIDDLKAGQTVRKSAYLSGAVARKAAAVRISVYRFYNGSTGAHFFTTNTTERDNVIANLSPPYAYEGPAFSVASDFSPGLSPVHRFFNTQTGVHFYTISEAERANVVATLPHFTYEGVAYHASQVAGQGLIPFYRFYVPSKGFHFYTANEAERASIQANLSAVYNYEGVGYYVLDSNWHAEKLPHTGITTSQCYAAGSNTLVTCTPTRMEIQAGGTSVNLYAQQDGHRTEVNPMSYSEVANPAGGTFPRTSCVRDDVTGLVWEGKTPTGERAGDVEYTYYNDGSTGDASAYVVRLNQLALCGFTDWRMPKRYELMTIYDHSKTTVPTIDTTWFTSTVAKSYWAAEGVRGSSSQAWYQPFGGHNIISNFSSRSILRSLRLVRGTFGTGTRFSYSSVGYGSDAANNVVNDAWTGLQWRRCMEGQTWNGSTCTGSVPTYTHEAAMALAKTKTGWRMPNMRELASLADVDPAKSTAIDAVAFPAGQYDAWSTTPVPGTSFAWQMEFQQYGMRTVVSRGGALGVRLLRAN